MTETDNYNDTLYKCTVCGRVGNVGRCCGNDTREPVNELARIEQNKIKLTDKKGGKP